MSVEAQFHFEDILLQAKTGQPSLRFIGIIMYYVYFLRSLKNSRRSYVGYTTNIKDRLETHNSGGSIHTAKYRPWELLFYSAFKNIDEAKNFELYLKTPSGKAFALKRLLPNKS